jgi:TM2 domain-containing membrane protein YozV
VSKPRRTSLKARQLVASAAGAALTVSLGASPAIAASANAGSSPRAQRTLQAALPDPDIAFRHCIIGAGVGFLSGVAVMTPLIIAGNGQMNAVNLFTTGSISTLAGALGSGAGHFYVGDPVRGLGLGALGTVAITGASLGGLVASTALGGGSFDTLAAASFFACAGTLVGWTYFMAGDARHEATERREVVLQPGRP